MDFLFSSLLERAHTVVPVDADIIKHCKALRLRSGEKVRVLNGKGLRALCEVHNEGSLLELRVYDREDVAPPRPLIVAMGMLDSKDRQEFAIEKVVELGATDIHILQTRFGTFMRTNQERIMAKVRSATTQCGRAWLPQIHLDTSVDDIVDLYGRDHIIVLGDQFGSTSLPAYEYAKGIVVVAGPEGGFSNEETTRLMSADHVSTVRISDNRLRAETAIVALTAVAALSI